MKKRLTYILSISMALLLFAMGATFIYYALFDKEFMFIVPAAVFFLLASVLLAFSLYEMLIGKREYVFEGETIRVFRKGKEVGVINKGEVRKLVLVYDVFYETLEYMRFTASGKIYFITCDGKNTESAKAFVADLSYKTDKNNLYYLLSALAHM